MLLRFLQTFIFIILKHLILTFACAFAFLEQQKFGRSLFYHFVRMFWIAGLLNLEFQYHFDYLVTKSKPIRSLSLPDEFSEIVRAIDPSLVLF